MDWEKDRQSVIEHMILLRRCDRDYAVWALKEYLAQEGCPHPDIAAEIKKRWESMSEDDRRPPWAKRTKSQPTSDQQDGSLSKGNSDAAD